MNRLKGTLLLMPALAAALLVMADYRVMETEHSVSGQLNGKLLWQYHHDPAEGKPYFHPLSSTDGTMFTDLRPQDHPWHRGVWFSWKYINGVNYWEENRKTGASDGETRMVDVRRSTSEHQVLRVELKLEYGPAGTDAVVMKERRTVAVSPPGDSGVYTIDWSSSFRSLDQDVILDRTPIPGQPGGKGYGGYAGWSVRMNPQARGGSFLNSEGRETAARMPASWMRFNAKPGGALLFMDHPHNLDYPPKWYVAPGMPYFSPAVIHDGPHTIKAGQALTLRYRLLVAPGEVTPEAAKAAWREWTADKIKVLPVTRGNNHK